MQSLEIKAAKETAKESWRLERSGTAKERKGEGENFLPWKIL